MKPIHIMDDIQWHALIRHVAEHVNDLTIKRGFQYFKQGRVQSLTMPGEERIEAVVEGNDNYSVIIITDSLSDSRCSCPVHKNCKHMIAVLLEYTTLQGRPVHALVNAQSTAMFSQTTKSSHTAGLNLTAIRPDHNTADSFTKLKEQASQLSGLSITEWHALFERCTGPLGAHIQNSQYANNTLDSIYAIKPQLTPVLEQLYELHAYLFVLSRLVKPFSHQGNSSNSYMGYHTQVAADDIQKEIKRLFGERFVITDEAEQWQRLTETVAYLRTHMLTESRNLTYFSDVYDQLWLNWIQPNVHDTHIYIDELQHLQSAAEELGSSLSRLPWLLARSRIHFYVSQDEEARSLLLEAGNAFNFHPGQLLHFVYALSKTEEWSRMQEWLIEIGPRLSKPRKDILTGYMGYWEMVIQHLPGAEQPMWDTLARMLPHAGSIYEETLHIHGRWKQWIDYQLSTGAEPLDFRVSVLQPIEKQAPELLLPFYHQAVERYVLHKNRSSYKAAVKLLKRLAKLYKKLKQEARWEQFITAFTGRHSRLRALQEELRRGKLIS